MRKRTPIRCGKCGKTAGYYVHTGKYHWGIPEVEISLNKGCIQYFKGNEQRFRCEKCKEVD